MSPLPAEFIERLRALIPDSHWPMVIGSFDQQKPLTIRINTLRCNLEQATENLRQQQIEYSAVDWKPDALIIPYQHRQRVIESDLYRQGLIYSQNLSSQLVPMILDPQPGEEILDMCAAPGSKTSQIACMMQNSGRLAAVEKIKNRYYKLKANLTSQKLSNVHTYLADGSSLWRKTPERFDRILLDAPCSSEGRFSTTRPQSYSRWKPKKIHEAARKQKKLITSAIQCLKHGGTLVYSTCSFAPEENEAVVDFALNKYSGIIEMQQFDIPVANFQRGITEWQEKNFDQSAALAIRILPDSVMDGFFVAKLKKKQR